MTDRLSLANALADAKIERSAAERIATEIFDPIHDNVATKADVQRLEAAMRERNIVCDELLSQGQAERIGINPSFTDESGA